MPRLHPTPPHPSPQPLPRALLGGGTAAKVMPLRMSSRARRGFGRRSRVGVDDGDGVAGQIAKHLTRLSSGIGPANDAREQVLRYSALGLGVFYGFYHQRTISSSQKAAAAQREYEHKQQLINKAKEAYAKTKQPAAAPSAAASSGRECFCSVGFTVERALTELAQ